VPPGAETDRECYQALKESFRTRERGVVPLSGPSCRARGISGVVALMKIMKGRRIIVIENWLDERERVSKRRPALRAGGQAEAPP
jgi:hypothetical protein